MVLSLGGGGGGRRRPVLQLASLHVLVVVLLLCQNIFSVESATVYLVPGLHNERYGVVAKEQPPSGPSGALNQIKRSRLDVVRLPLSKVISQIKSSSNQRREDSANNAAAAAAAGGGGGGSPSCSSLMGPFCFQSFTEGLSISEFDSKFPHQGVLEVSQESLQLTILSSPGDVLILLYDGKKEEAIKVRTNFVKAGLYLKNQIDVAAIDCSINSESDGASGGKRSSISNYCKEVEDVGQSMLKHFKRLSDNFYTIHTKPVMSTSDVSIYSTIEFVRGGGVGGGGGHQAAASVEDPRRKHANKRMLVIRNRSVYTITVSWAMENENERLYYELVPGSSQLVNAFVTQKWLIRESRTKALVKQIEVDDDLTQGGVILHVITTEVVQKNVQKAAESGGF